MIFLIARIIILIQGLFRIGITVSYAVRTESEWMLIIAAIMFLSAALYIFAAWWLGKKTKPAFYFTIALLLFDLSVTITDQLGWWDVANMGIDATAIVILIISRKQFK